MATCWHVGAWKSLASMIEMCLMCYMLSYLWFKMINKYQAEVSHMRAE